MNGELALLVELVGLPQPLEELVVLALELFVARRALLELLLERDELPNVDAKRGDRALQLKIVSTDR